MGGHATTMRINTEISFSSLSTQLGANMGELDKKALILSLARSFKTISNLYNVMNAMFDIAHDWEKELNPMPPYPGQEDTCQTQP